MVEEGWLRGKTKQASEEAGGKLCNTAHALIWLYVGIVMNARHCVASKSKRENEKKIII